MNKKLKITLIIIAILCILILLVEVGYMLYKSFFYEEEKTYFDSINAFSIVDKGYVAVGSNNNNDKQHEKAKITKYVNQSEKKWETLYNKGYNSVFFDVCNDADDAYVAVGSYEATKKENEEGLRSALLVKYDKNGTLMFSRRFQVLGSSKFTRVKPVKDGYIVVGQSIYENMTMGTSTEGGAFIIKYDKEGNIVWKDKYGGSKSGLFNDFVVVDNRIFVVGKDAARVGVIVEYNMKGERQNSANYEYTDTLGFTSVAYVNDNLFAVGAKKMKEDKEDYDTDALIVRYNKDLNITKENMYRGKGIERFNKVIVDHNDDLVVVGQSGVYNKKKSTKALNVFSYDGLLAKYKEDLKEVFANLYGDNKDDYFTDVKEEKDNYVLTGYSRYEDNNFFGKFIVCSKAGKVLDVK